MAIRRVDERRWACVLVLWTLLLLGVTSGVSAGRAGKLLMSERTEAKLDKSDDRIRERIRHVYREALYGFRDCSVGDTHGACCSSATKSIISGTGLELCDLYKTFLFTRGIIFVCERPSIEQSCPELLVRPREKEKCDSTCTGRTRGNHQSGRIMVANFPNKRREKILDKMSTVYSTVRDLTDQ